LREVGLKEKWKLEKEKRRLGIQKKKPAPGREGKVLQIWFFQPSWGRVAKRGGKRDPRQEEKKRASSND